MSNIPNAVATDRDDPHKYLDPVALAKVRSLEIQARLIVEGFLSGMHKIAVRDTLALAQHPPHGRNSSRRRSWRIERPDCNRRRPQLQWLP